MFAPSPLGSSIAAAVVDVVRQGLYLSYCTVSRVLRVSAGRVVVGSSCDRGAVGAAVPCDRDRRVERVDLYL